MDSFNSANKSVNNRRTQAIAGHSLRQQLLVFILSFVCIGASLVWYSYASRAELLEHEKTLLENKANIVTVALAERLQATSDLMTATGVEILTAHDQLNSGVILTRRLCTITTSIAGIETLMVFNSKGEKVASSREQQLPAKPLHSESLRTVRNFRDVEQLHLSEPFQSAQGDFAIALGKAIHDAASNFVGTVIAEVRPAFFEAIL